MEPRESGDSQEAPDITGEDLSQGHVGMESRLLNAYCSLIVRDQNVNRAAARHEDVIELCSFVSHVVRSSLLLTPLSPRDSFL